MHDALQRLPGEATDQHPARPAAPHVDLRGGRGIVEASQTLDWLRRSHARQRSAARLDLATMVQAFAVGRAGTELVSPDALVAALPEALGRVPRIYRPGSAETSFDEAWLLALIAALRRGDRTSAAFLLRSRVRPPLRRSVEVLTRAALRTLDPKGKCSIVEGSQSLARQSPNPRSS